MFICTECLKPIKCFRNGTLGCKIIAGMNGVQKMAHKWPWQFVGVFTVWYCSSNIYTEKICNDQKFNVYIQWELKFIRLKLLVKYLTQMQLKIAII